MERFVELVVAGGVALVAGLWVARLATRAGDPVATWGLVGGAAVALAGAVALAAGVEREVEWRG